MILKNFGMVTVMSLGFCLLFIAFNTCQNLSSQVLKEDGFNNLGFTSLAVLYLVFSVASFFSTAIVNKIGYVQVALSSGSFCYTFWILCFLLPSYYSEADDKDNLPFILNRNIIEVMLIATAAINGAGAGILWVAEGKFISLCACDENKGFYNGFFWAVFQSSQVFGNLIGYFVL